MGLFHINYDKPGPGVRKDEPEKNAVVRFFLIFFRKFSQFIELNLLFSIFAAISLVTTYFAEKFLSPFLSGLIPVLLISPFLAGITFVTRNYAKQEHVFLVSDFFDAVKLNWKAFLINGFICYVLYFILNFSIRFYFDRLSDGAIHAIAFYLCITVAIFLVFAQYYVPLMIVTFDLKLIQIYKNALIFAVIGLWRNFLLTVLLAALSFGIYFGFYISQITPFSLIIVILFAATLLFSLSFFMINYVIYPLVYQTMIQPYQKQQEKQPETGLQKEETDLESEDKK